MHKRKLFPGALLLILISASCGPSVIAQPPTPAPATIPPTWTPTVVTAIPTFTEFPTFTPVPPLPPLSTPTVDPLDALSERFQDSLFSPNGRWTAYRDPDKLRVVNTEDPLRVWTLPCALFDECSTIYPVKWSRNSQVLYFAPAPKAGGAPDNFFQFTALGMISVRRGEWQIVLPDSDRHYEFSFSPDDDYIAYTQSSGVDAEELSMTLGIIAVENKKYDQKFTLDGAYGGNFIWSPFKPRFVFVVYHPELGSAIGYYDIETDFLKYALEPEESDILLLEWGQDNLVSLEMKDWVTQQRTNRELNPFTGELTGD